MLEDYLVSSMAVINSMLNNVGKWICYILTCKGLFNISSHWSDLHIVIPVSEDVWEGLEGIKFKEKNHIPVWTLLYSLVCHIQWD